MKTTIRTQTAQPRWARRALAVAVAAAWLAPMAAHAEEMEGGADGAVHGTAEIGLGHQSDDSFRFGQNTGMTDEGVFGVLNVEMSKRDPNSAGTANYMNLKATDLGLKSRNVRAEVGDQGNYKVWFEYDQLPMNRSDSAQTIFDGAGGERLTLPPGWVPGANSTGVGEAQILAAMRDVDIEHDRKAITLGFGKTLPGGWEFKTSYKHEKKEGTRTIGAVFGNSGGNPRSVVVPEPVNYETDQVEAVLSYGDRQKQFQLGYYLSMFNDNYSSLSWQNPYTNGAWAGMPVGYPNEGRLALPPDNKFHQITASGGYNISDGLRVMGDLALGRMTQNASFLPYTNISGLTAADPLPRSSLDGRIDTTVFNLRVNGRPSTALYWNVAYRYDDRNNKTPHDLYNYIGGDSMNQSTNGITNRYRYNEPYSAKEQSLKGDMGYKLAARTDLTAGLEHSKVERTLSEREENDETTIKLGLRSQFNDMVSGNIRLSRADRDGSEYHYNHPLVGSYVPGYYDGTTCTGTTPSGQECWGPWSNHPDLRKLYMADRIRDRIALGLTATPNQALTVGFSVNYQKDDYKKSDLGLTESTIDNYTLDAAYMASPSLTLTAFYSHDRMKSDQDNGRVTGTTTTGARQDFATDPANQWWAKHRNSGDTIGLGLRKEIVDSKFDIGVDLLHSRTKGKIDVGCEVGNLCTGNANTAPTALPDLTTRLNSFSIWGKYALSKDKTIKVGYLTERYKAKDFALEDAPVTQLANVITLNEEVPDYRVHVITVSLAYKF